MNEMLIDAGSSLAGGAIGLMFYAGLWWTVKKGTCSTRPALWFSVSLLSRTTIALIGFYLVAGTHLNRLIFAMLGFVTARLVVSWLGRPRLLPAPIVVPEPTDAP